MDRQWTRRRFLEASAVAVAAAAVPSAAARAKSAKPAGFDAYRRLDAVALAQLVRRGEATPTELLELAIARAETVDPRLTAIVVRHFDAARAAVAASKRPVGPLAGVPFLLKDLGIAMAGTITTEGSRFFRDQQNDFDSTLVARFREAGLVIFGKTHSPEFGASPSSESALHGATHNPWDLSRSAGGSSGGAAAAVAAGIVPAAHATDGGGSIRIPASACGLFGLKPTRGRVPMGPRVYEGWGGMSAAHCVSRSVRDSAVLLDAIQGPATRGRLRRAAPRTALSRGARGAPRAVCGSPGCAGPYCRPRSIPECDAAAARTAALCESLGHAVEEAAPSIDIAAVYQGFSLLASAGTALKVAQREAALGRPARRDEIEDINWTTIETGRAASGVDYARAREAIHGASRVLGAFMERYDLILSPTMALVPAKLGALSLSQETSAFTGPATRASAFTSLFNITGQPAMSVPLHWTAPVEGAPAGLPIGVQFAARFGDEATLFRLASQLESAQPWFDRLPPI